MFGTNRALSTTDRAFAHATVTRSQTPQPPQPATDYRSHLALREADRILRENVSPEMEPLEAHVEDDDPSRDMEPLDPTVDDQDEGADWEGEGRAKATVSGDESEVTITADEGEVLSVDEADGAIIVSVDPA